MSKGRIAGIFLLIISGALFAVVIFLSNNKFSEPTVFSQKTMMTALWEDYKRRNLEAESGRTIDYQRDGITTSEGQSYTMLRAVWLDDRTTFDRTWKWTKDISQRPSDKLFSWLFGKKPDGTYGILTDKGGQNSASDADTDIAFALFQAYARWGDIQYLKEAIAIIPNIWEQEVITVGGKPYLASNNLEKSINKKTILVNPSYLAPYEYRYFAMLDPGHDWMALVASSYDFLGRAVTEPLDRSRSAGLPPDWVDVDRTTGELSAASGSGLTTDYGFDALRVPWRIALDWEWNQAPAASSLLAKMSFFEKQWENGGALSARYTHDGAQEVAAESPAAYGGALGYFVVKHPDLAASVYERKLKSLYDPDTDSWKTAFSYYDDNWAWFGLGLYHNYLTDLGKSVVAINTDALLNK